MQGGMPLRGVPPFLFATKREGVRAMAQSQNTKVDLTIKATSFAGMGTYGDVLLGDVAFEFYNEKNPEDYIQIPWDEIDYVSAEVIGKKITRFAIFIKQGGHFSFSTRDNKKTLRAVRDHIGEEKLQRSPSVFRVMKAGFVGIGKGVANVFRGKNKDQDKEED